MLWPAKVLYEGFIPFSRANAMTEDNQNIEQETQSPVPQPPKSRGKAKIEVKVEFELDDATVFNLQGDGIKTVTVVTN